MSTHDSICVRLSFGRSNSAYYADAVAIAQDLPGYRRSGEGKALIHSVDVELPLMETELWNRVLQLHQIASRWNSCQVVLEGTPFESLSDLARLLNSIRNCQRWREETGLGDTFCSDKVAPDADAQAFGCRQIGGVSRALFGPRSHAEFSWYQFGNLCQENTLFVIDKDAIMSMLRHRAWTRLCRFCPSFSWERVQRDVDDLPDELLLDGESRFELRYSEINSALALGVQPRRPRLREGDHAVRPRLRIARRDHIYQRCDNQAQPPFHRKKLIFRELYI